MSPKVRWILIIVVVLLVILVVAGIAFMAAKKGTTGPDKEPLAPPPGQDEISKAPKMGRFNLGEFVASTRDEELHYVKMEVELGFMGSLEKNLEESKAELRDAITRILMKSTLQRLKEDYVDQFLHKEIEQKMNEVLGTAKSESRVVKIFIPVFMVN
jgi:flagellar basal body-associated protein FliL